MSQKCCSGDGEGRKDKGGGGKMVCDKVVCVKDGVVKDGVWQRWCGEDSVWKMVCERWSVTVCERWCVSKMWCQRWCVKEGVWQSGVWKMVCEKVVWKMVCDKVVCERWCVKGGVWQSCVWKMVCDKVVCERWCVWKMVCDKVVCERWCMKDGVWQSCVWKMVCDKVVCESWCVKDGVKDGVWKMVCQRWCERWYVTKWCDKDGVWKMVCDKVVCQRWCVTKLCVKDSVWKVVCDKVVRERWCESEPRTPPGGSACCACHTPASSGPAAATRAAGRPGGSVHCACHTKAAAPPGGSVYCACQASSVYCACHAKAAAAPAGAMRAASCPGGSIMYCACHTKGSRGPSGGHARHSSSRTLSVLRLPRERQPRLLQDALCTAPATRKAAAAPAAATRAAAPPGRSVYCACHAKSSRGPTAGHARRSSSRTLCVLRLPHERQPRPQRRPRAPQLLQDALCAAPATRKAAAAPPGRSVYCACHTKGSRGPSGGHARRSSSRTLCVLRLPREKQPRPHRRPRAPQLLQDALCTAPATRKAAAATRKAAAAFEHVGWWGVRSFDELWGAAPATRKAVCWPRRSGAVMSGDVIRDVRGEDVIREVWEVRCEKWRCDELSCDEWMVRSGAVMSWWWEVELWWVLMVRSGRSCDELSCDEWMVRSGAVIGCCDELSCDELSCDELMRSGAVMSCDEKWSCDEWGVIWWGRCDLGGGSGGSGGNRRSGGIQAKKQEPHSVMWGINQNIQNTCKSRATTAQLTVAWHAWTHCNQRFRVTQKKLSSSCFVWFSIVKYAAFTPRAQPFARAIRLAET